MRKDLRAFHNLSRLASASHFRSMKAYSPSNVFAWVKGVGAYWLRPKHKFVEYPSSETLAADWTYIPQGSGAIPGVYRMGTSMKIAMAADWGTGTDEAYEVGAQMAQGDPDFTIHLGDIYYVGKLNEVNENFLGIKVPASPYPPVRWPLGKEGTFVLPGNHEFYSNGDAYFDDLLPSVGQSASYFCLQNDCWRILGLDTGYNSTGLEFGPIQPSCKLPDQVVAWLKTLDLDNQNDARPIIVLTHHQPWSAFDREYPAAANQLATLLRRPFLWFWGHEHRMAVYGRHEMKLSRARALQFKSTSIPGLTAYGRCIGHGGMPVEIKTPNPKKSSVVFYDRRPYPNDEGLDVSYNGYAELQFNGPVLDIAYRDLKGMAVYGETFTPASFV